MLLPNDDPLAVAMLLAIRGGDVAEVQRLIDDHPGIAAVRVQGRKGGSRTPLHMVADWPGYFPCGPQLVHLLVDAGADPDAPVRPGVPSETPLHWAASSDDVDVAAALIDRGADIEAQGASIAGGPPLDCAVGYGCWHVARLLVERGARVDRLWHAAALGMTARVKELQAADPPPTQQDLDAAFWQACHGGQRRTAEHLLGCGASVNAIPDYSDDTALDIAGSVDTRRDLLITWLRDHDARSAAPAAPDGDGG